MPCVRQDFLDISNPKAVLEMTLRGFSCLTRGDCICLHYNNKKYYIDIIEAKPQVSTTPCIPTFSASRGYPHQPCRPDMMPGVHNLLCKFSILQVD